MAKQAVTNIGISESGLAAERELEKMKIRKQRIKNFTWSAFLGIILCCGALFIACGGSWSNEENRTDEENRINEERADEGNGAGASVLEHEWEEEETQKEIPEKTQDTEDVTEQNKEKFYQLAQEQGLDEAEAQVYYERLCEDDVFRDGTAVLISLYIEDLDGNGQKDMIAMVQEGAFYLYGEGGIYFYMNEDEAYCFREDYYPFCKNLNVVTGDFDNDGNVEIVFESMGTGCGGAGDWYVVMLKYKNHGMEEMKLPAEPDERHYIRVQVTQEMQKDTYSAYCPYLDETIFFEAENHSEPNQVRVVGGSMSDYFNICSMEYEGRDALVVSEYLCGEGGTVHCVGIARFLMLWEKDGSSRIEKWWIDQR